MKSEKKENRSELQTVSRAFELLRCFDGGRRRLTLAQLSQALDLNKVTVMRLARTLETEQALQRNEKGEYQISYGLLSLARTLIDQDDIVTLAKPVLTTLRDETGETANWNSFDGESAVVLASAVSTNPIRYVLEVGFRGPLYIGAAGLAILAFLPTAERERILNQSDLVRTSDGRNVDTDELKNRLREIQLQGVAVTRGERVVGAFGAASPVFDAEGCLRGSVSALWPQQRASDQHFSEIITSVTSAANRLNEALGGHRRVGEKQMRNHTGDNTSL